jgi:hypothetical protein
VKLLVILLFCCGCLQCFSQDTSFLKVHFLYGSRPLKKYKDTEPKWFGGIHGGHVGIEGGNDKILNFLRHDKFHWFSNNNNRHSLYAEHSSGDFYTILGGNSDSVKKTIVYIPVTPLQKHSFDSIGMCYLSQTPYDYAFIGMRCGAAAYEILSQLDVVRHYSNTKTSLKIFYPKKLRKRLLKKASENGWKVERFEGSGRRKWERD